MTEAGPALTFEPPGPGSWHRDPVHFPRPVTRYFAETHPEPFIRGTSEFMAFYGTPIGRHALPVRQRIRVQHDATGARRGDPAAVRPRRGGVGAQGLA